MSEKIKFIGQVDFTIVSALSNSIDSLFGGKRGLVDYRMLRTQTNRDIFSKAFGEALKKSEGILALYKWGEAGEAVNITAQIKTLFDAYLQEKQADFNLHDVVTYIKTRMHRWLNVKYFK
ncbi:MAG: hypothetical protein ABIH82_05180 [Candidatus Woesearchaeota archaeon]